MTEVNAPCLWRGAGCSRRLVSAGRWFLVLMRYATDKELSGAVWIGFDNRAENCIALLSHGPQFISETT